MFTESGVYLLVYSSYGHAVEDIEGPGETMGSV